MLYLARLILTLFKSRIRIKTCCVVSAIFLVAASLSPSHAAPVIAKKTDDFASSIGINIKLDRNVYNNNWSQVKNRFKELGIWHYRDGLQLVNNNSTYRSRYQSLYNEAGAIGLFVWGPWENLGKTGNQAVGAA